MLKHLLPYKEVFSVWFEANYSEALLSPQHWYAAEQIMKFLKLLYEATVTLSGVYYPTAPLMLHHILDFAKHLHNAENDLGFRNIAIQMKFKFLKYWEKIPLLYSYAFILDPRAKLEGFSDVLELLASHTTTSYSVYYSQVKDKCQDCLPSMNKNLVQLCLKGLLCLMLVLVKGSKHGEKSMLVLVHPLVVPLLHLLHLVVLMSCQHTWTVILSRIGGSPLTYYEDHVWFEDRWMVASLCDE
jgi:hypothetical protein